ncbi:MAG TPA: hypothetical protein VGF16_05305 [Bryobacteraceae bacterium]
MTIGEEGGSVAALEPALKRARVIAESIRERIRRHGNAHTAADPKPEAETN